MKDFNKIISDLLIELMNANQKEKNDIKCLLTLIIDFLNIKPRKINDDILNQIPTWLRDVYNREKESHDKEITMGDANRWADSFNLASKQDVNPKYLTIVARIIETIISNLNISQPTNNANKESVDKTASSTANPSSNFESYFKRDRHPPMIDREAIENSIPNLFSFIDEITSRTNK